MFRLMRRLTTIVVLWAYYTRWPGRWIRRGLLPEPARRVANWSAIRFENAMKRIYIPVMSDLVFKPGPGSIYTKLVNQTRNPNTDTDRMRFGFNTDWPTTMEAEAIKYRELREHNYTLALKRRQEERSPGEEFDNLMNHVNETENDDNV